MKKKPQLIPPQNVEMLNAFYLKAPFVAVINATNQKSRDILSNDLAHGQAAQSLGIPHNFFQSGSRRCSLSFSDS